MPEPKADPNKKDTLRIAGRIMAFGVVITILKFIVFYFTNSVAVLSDALESIINIVAAAAMLYSVWYSNRPADKTHPYGHGKVEFLTIGFEGTLILSAGIVIAVTAIYRLVHGIEPQKLGLGLTLLFIVGILTAALAAYALKMGSKFKNEIITADGKHLATDVLSTVGVFVGLLLVHFTNWAWLDPLVALFVAAGILTMSWRLLWQSIDGLMDRSDPHDQATILAILDDEIDQGSILSYHKVRHRHTGSFHWVDMHLQVQADLTVQRAHEITSAIELRIEQALGQANATAHVEPPNAICRALRQMQSENHQSVNTLQPTQSPIDIPTSIELEPPRPNTPSSTPNSPTTPTPPTTPTTPTPTTTTNPQTATATKEPPTQTTSATPTPKPKEAESHTDFSPPNPNA